MLLDYDRGLISLQNKRPVRKGASAIALAAAAAVPVIGIAAGLQAANLSELDQALVLLADQAKPSDPELLQRALEQYNKAQYENAQITLQQIKADGLPQSDRNKLRDTLQKVEQALGNRQAARAAFEQGEAALAGKDYGQAGKFYRQAIDNKYADEATKGKAISQLAVVQAAQKGEAQNLKDTYKQAVADYKAGNYPEAKAKFAKLEEAGYKGGLFDRSPSAFLKDIEKKSAQAAAPAEPKVDAPKTEVKPQPEPVAQPSAPGAADEYKAGVEAFRSGDYATAKKHFRAAQEANYKPGLFKDSPAEYLASIEKAEAEAIAATQPKPVTPADEYKAGVEAYKAGDYAAAKKSFQAAQGAGYKAPLFKDSPAEYLTAIEKAEAAAVAATQPKAPTAREQYEAGVEAFKAGDYAAAKKQFQAAQEAGYKPGLFKDTPAEYLARIEKTELAAVAATQPKPVTPAEEYRKGVEAFNAGDYATAKKHFSAAEEASYRPGAFKDTPAEYMARMEKSEQAAIAATQPKQLTPKEEYEAGVAAYRAGDYAQAKAHFMEAQAAGYKPGLFRDPPARYLSMIEQRTAQEPVQPGPVQPGPVAVAPQTQPVLTPEQQALLDTQRLEAARKEQQAFVAQQLVEKANTARAENRVADAYVLYRQAAESDPGNAAAARGLAETQQLVKGEADQGMLARQLEARKAQQEQIIYRFDRGIAQAQEAIAQGQFNLAQEGIEAAQVARSLDPALFTGQELARLDETIAQTQFRLAQARADVTRREQEQAKNVAIAEAQQAEQLALQEKRDTVRQLTGTAKQLVYEGNYRQALGVINQILAIDPTNDYAVGVKQFVSDYAVLQEQKFFKEKIDREWERVFNSAEEAKIPYMDLMNYPRNWPDIAETRDRELAAERQGGADDLQVRAQLDRRLPEIRFDQVAFGDVVDFLRDVTGANLFVNWRALEAAGIEKTAPVTARLRDVKFSKALSTILGDVGGGTVKLAYTVDEGVITISTAEDLNKNVDIQVYDIRDLLVIPPDIDNPPSFDLNQGSGASGGGGRSGGRSGGSSRSGGGGGGGNPFLGGGGGGGGGGGMFGGGGGGGGGGSGTSKTEEDLVKEITDLIKETVDRDSWIDNGGRVGSLKFLSGQLIVTQTPENHRQVVSLLDKLRETRAIQVSIETRFLTVQRNYMEDIGIDLDFFFNINDPVNWSPIAVQQDSTSFTTNPVTPVPGSLGGTAQPAMTVQGSFLDDFQVNFLIRATQVSQQSTIVTAPRITVFNAQRAYIIVGNQQAYVSDLETETTGGNYGGSGAVAYDPIIDVVTSGVQLLVQPTVSADRKYVTLSLTPQLSQLVDLATFAVSAGTNDPDNPSFGMANIQLPLLQITSLQTIVSVPDGGTLLLGGQTLAGEVEVEEGVPILSKIPFLKRLFTNRSMAKDEQILLILVKPTIIIQREVEQQQFPLLNTKPRS